MNAALNQDLRLEFKGDKSLPRRLVVTLEQARSGDRYLCAHMFTRNIPDTCSMAYANELLADCRINAGVRYLLWIGGAAFDLTAPEAAEIHAQLSPLGLRSEFKATP